MKTISVQHYKSDCKLQWDAFCAKAPNATFLFQRDFMDYHGQRFQDFSLMVFEEEELIAVLPAHVIKKEVYSHRGLTYGNLVLKDISLKNTLVVFEAILSFLKTEGKTHLELKLLPNFYHQINSDALNYGLFLTQAKKVGCETVSVLNISQPLKQHQQRKRGIKKGIKHHLEVRQDGNFQSFWNGILRPLLHTKFDAEPVHSLAEIDALAAQFPQHIKQYNVYKDNDIVAGVTIFETKLVAHTQYIAANNDRQQLGSLDYLFHWLITEVYQEKKYLSFGTSNAQKGAQLQTSLHSWKEGFGTETRTLDTYVVETRNHYLIKNALA